jgi:hypothetical protein
MTTRIIRYVGGPPDGQQLDADELLMSDADLRLGTYEIVDGWTDRADYAPDPGGDPLARRYRGPVPD